MTKIQNTFKKMVSHHPPIWLMRQAGRYLPEYRKLRQEFPSFMEFCRNSQAATTATLQPINRFDFDAAIIFSDILTIPHAMGQTVSFVPQQGPVLEPIQDWNTFLSAAVLADPQTLESTYQTIKLTRHTLPQEKSLFGFAGAPWTLMTYMLGKKGSDYSKIITFAAEHPKLFKQLQCRLIEVISSHLIEQINAGADMVQLFDSWAAAVPQAQQQAWVVEPIVQIVNKVHQQTAAPIIVFAKGAEYCYPQIAAQIEQTTKLGFSLGSAAALTQPVKGYVLQGGLNPETLVQGGERLATEVQQILQAHAGTPYIFNLGHGILPHTPLAHVEQLVNLVAGH